MREITPDRPASFNCQLTKQKELASWDACKVYELVNDVGQEFITCRGVLGVKVLEDGSTKPKARLVARGFQGGLRDVDIFSPTCSKASWPALLLIAAYDGWAPVAVDI